jgi:hypothetical protein
MGSTFPGLRLRLSAEHLALARSATNSLPRSCGEDRRPQPVARLFYSTVSSFLGLTLPFRTFRPFGLSRQSGSAQEAHLLRYARFPFAPQRYSIRITVGSSFPIRYAHMMIAIRGRAAKAFPPRQPNPPDLVYEQSSILTQRLNVPRGMRHQQAPRAVS